MSKLSRLLYKLRDNLLGVSVRCSRSPDGCHYMKCCASGFHNIERAQMKESWECCAFACKCHWVELTKGKPIDPIINLIVIALVLLSPVILAAACLLFTHKTQTGLFSTVQPYEEPQVVCDRVEVRRGFLGWTTYYAVVGNTYTTIDADQSVRAKQVNSGDAK